MAQNKHLKALAYQLQDWPTGQDERKRIQSVKVISPFDQPQIKHLLGGQGCGHIHLVDPDLPVP
jgi:hypothetical protein